MNKNIEVVVAIPNDYWTGKNQTCLLAVNGTNILSAVCIKEPAAADHSYREEILQVSHTDTLSGDTLILGQFNGGEFRDQYTNEHWKQLEHNGLDREYLVSTLKEYKLTLKEID